jgi:hypothetical protein
VQTVLIITASVAIGVMVAGAVRLFRNRMPRQREQLAGAIEGVWRSLLAFFLLLLGFAILLAMRAPDAEAFLTIVSVGIALVYLFLFLRSRRR